MKVIETNDGVSAGIVAVLKSQALGGEDHELLCALLPDHEGYGLATKACRLMLNEVSYDPSVHRVIGCVHRENTSSLALINRLGGTFWTKRGTSLNNQITTPRRTKLFNYSRMSPKITTTPFTQMGRVVRFEVFTKFCV